MLDAPKDYLTHCYTREGLLPFLKKMEEEFTLLKKPFTLLIMDVDHFKTFNDRYGHLNGDEVLKYFSSSLRLDLEDEENQPFRFGGDEFIMVFPNKNAAEAYHLAQRLRRNIKTRSCLIKGKQVTITFSGGIASYPHDAQNLEELMDKADQALYYSKKAGRSRVTRYDDIIFKKVILVLMYVLVIIGGMFALELLLQDFSLPVKKWSNWTKAWTQKMSQHTFQLPKAPFSSTHETKPGSVSAPVEPAPPAAPGQPTAPSSPAPETAVQPVLSQIYLKSGRMIEGTILSERDDEMEVGVGVQEGKGSIRIKKSQISKIVTGNQTRSVS